MSAAVIDDQRFALNGRTLRTSMTSDDEKDDDDRMVDLSGLGQSAKLTELGALKDIKMKPIAALTLSKLDEAGDDLFTSPKFKTWVNYVASVAEKHSTTTMMSKLTAQYSDGSLIRMLEAAKKVEGANEIALRLQQRQVRTWIKAEKTADDIFELLKLDEGIEKLLTNSNLGTYVSYMNLFNKYSPGKETTLVNTFVTYYGDEAVAKTIEAAKNEPGSEKLAKELQVALFSQWLREGAQPKDIWKMLGLKEGTVNVSPNGEIWRGYEAFFSLHS